MLANIKLLLGINDTSKDAILNLLISICQSDALEYTHLDESRASELDDIVISMVLERYNKLGNEGVASASYGGISEQFMEDYSSGIYKRLRTHKKIRVC